MNAALRKPFFKVDTTLPFWQAGQNTDIYGVCVTFEQVDLRSFFKKPDAIM